MKEKNRIEEKIFEIETYLENIIDFRPQTLDEYKNDLKTKAACERVFEKIIESCIDLAFLIIKKNKFSFPEDDEGAFYRLFKQGIISEDLSKRLISAKGMRNFIVHKYGEIDDSKVFHSISEELEKDINDFISSIKGCLR